MRYASDVHAKVNLIEYNPIDGGEFGRTDQRTDAMAFMYYLESKGIVARIRRSRGRTSMLLAVNWRTRMNRP